MSNEKDKRDFLLEITLLRRRSQRLYHQHEEYIFMTKMYNEGSSTVSFVLYHKDKMYQKDFDYDSFLDYKQSMGLEGTWKMFLLTMVNAIECKEGGELKIESSFLKDELKLIIVHPISKEVKISGSVTLNLIKDNLKENLYKGIEELYEGNNELRELLEKEREKNKLMSTNSFFTPVTNITANIDEGNTKNNSMSSAFDIQLKQKRKFHSNLINPNIKKRKKKGATFTQEEAETDHETNYE